MSFFLTKCTQAWTLKNKRIQQTRKRVLDIGFRYTSKSQAKIKNDFYKRIVEIGYHAADSCSNSYFSSGKNPGDPCKIPEARAHVK